ncbi:MAG TPA: RCC1 domain-containing protein, partial [Myxococcota bacterium]|nr:RCC1 domain-containing protein [Myxococcota bacterium]
GDGRVHCWGDGRDHRLGNGMELSSRVPLQVPGVRGVARVVAGGRVTCALRTEGEVLCWGGLERRTVGDEDLFEPVM